MTEVPTTDDRPRCVGCGAVQVIAHRSREGTVLLCPACAAFADLGCP